MAILDIFKKKKEELPIGDVPMPDFGGQMPQPPLPTGAPELTEVPLSQVMTMQQQGLTNNQIIQTLQRQGYQPTQIYDALAQSEAKKSIEPGEPMPEREMPRRQKHPDTEAVVEQIIEEKWTTLQKDLSKLTEWKEAITSRMDKLEQQSQDVRTDLEGLHKAIVSRIGEYDKTLVDVGTEIKAMEKVFQKVLPELTTNIQELSRITKTAKGEPSRLINPPESLSQKMVKPAQKK